MEMDTVTRVQNWYEADCILHNANTFETNYSPSSFG